MRRFLYVGIIYLCFNALYCFPTFADDWEVYEAEIWEVDEYDYYDDWEVATSSVATRSNASRGEPSLFGSYTPYDSSIPTSVIQYMSDTIPKLGNVSYVLFRSGQYDYRLVYADDLQYNNGVFSSPSADYISYDSRYYKWYSGSEGNFTLRTNDYIVYSDLGDSPALSGSASYTYALLLLGMVFLLFSIYRSFFAPGSLRI